MALLLAALALAGCGGGPEAEPARNTMDVEEEDVCEGPAEEAPVNLLQRVGIVEQADYWDCERPVGAGGDFGFDEITGTQATVTGATADYTLHWYGPGDIAGRNLLFWTGPAGGGPIIQNGMVSRSRGRGYYRWVIPEVLNPLELQFVLQPEATGGDLEFHFAIDDTMGQPVAPSVGDVSAQSLYVIEVGSGDIQISLNWDTLVDLDLWVTDPTGFKTYYGDLIAPSGGELDLDSYPACHFEGDRGRGNENVFWPIGSAPGGQYTVQVDMFDDCGTYAAGVVTNYRVIAVNHGRHTVHTGTFPARERGETHVVTTFDY